MSVSGSAALHKRLERMKLQTKTYLCAYPTVSSHDRTVTIYLKCGLALKKRTRRLCNAWVSSFGLRSQWANDSPGRTMARRRLCSQLQAVTYQAVRNHKRSDLWVSWRMVPAVTKTGYSQAAHWYCQRRIFHPTRCSHRGHTNPSGQRNRSRYAWQLPSVPKRSANSSSSDG